MKGIVKHLVSFILPITATMLIPGAILARSERSMLQEGSRFAGMRGLVGLVFLLTGVLLLFSTIRTFILIGKGTLAPWSPTSNLVVGGIYGYVRNPMITGVALILTGEGLVFNSVGIMIWAVGFTFINHLYFLFVEEPGLLDRFGEAYQHYQSNVPRWIPRRKPWKP